MQGSNVTVNGPTNDRFTATLPDNRINHLTSALATSDNPLGEAVPPHGEKVDLKKERLGMRGLRIALGFVGVFGLTATAVAAEPGFYIGGGVGQYDAQVEHPISAAAATIGGG